MPDRVIRVNGVEHRFPGDATDDEIRAALETVAKTTPPKSVPIDRASQRVDTNIIGFNQDKWTDLASKLPEKVLGVPVRRPVAMAGSLAGTVLESLSAPENVATMGAAGMSGRLPDVVRPGPLPTPSPGGLVAAGKVIAKDIPIVRRMGPAVRAYRAYQKGAAADAAAKPALSEVLKEAIAEGTTPTEAGATVEAPAPTPVPIATAVNTVHRAATAAKIKLTAEEFQAGLKLVQEGYAEDAVLDAIKAQRMEALTTSGSFANLPSDAEVASDVAARNATGRWGAGSSTTPKKTGNPFR